jgi:hypothetical protein
MGNHVHVLAMPEKETSLARGIGGTNPILFGIKHAWWQHQYNIPMQ